MDLAATTDAMAQQWSRISERYAAYALVLPGEPSFICQAAVCTAHCCHAFSVSLGDAEVERLQRASGLAFLEFIEAVDGEAFKLPLAQPYLLARAENHCKLLAPDLACAQYEGRPNACRQYPHQVLVVDAARARPVHADLPAMTATVEAIAAGRALPAGGLVPLLLRHVECPGFTGAPLDPGAWATLLQRTFALQYTTEAIDSPLPP